METRLSAKDLAVLKDKVIFTLEKGDNAKFADVPSIEYLDMKIVFRIVLGSEDDAKKVGLVSYSLMNDMGLTEQDLFELAKVNTPRIFPAVCRHIFHTLNSMLGLQLFEDGEDSVAFSFPMFVLTNELMTHGANVILYKDTLSKIADKFKTDLYVIPCSINEILIHPVTEDMGVMELKSLINNVNSTELKPEDVLSDSLYYYDRETDKLRIA